MRRIALASAMVAALVFGLVGPAGAGLPPNFDYDPTSGPPGTVISASGSCDVFTIPAAQAGTDAPSGLAGTVTLELSDPGGTVLDTATGPMTGDGDWSLEVTVPNSTPTGEYDLDASCTFGFVPEDRASSASLADSDSPSGNGQTFFYATQVFTVTAQATTTVAPTSTAGPTTTTTPAVAAQAQRVQPAFTG